MGWDVIDETRAFYGFLKRHGMDLAKVPYRDIVQAPTDLAEGRIHLLMASLAVQQALMQAGKIKVLAVGGQRTPLYPDIPTGGEAGYPDVENDGLPGARKPHQHEPSLALVVGNLKPTEVEGLLFVKERFRPFEEKRS